MPPILPWGLQWLRVVGDENECLIIISKKILFRLQMLKNDDSNITFDENEFVVANSFLTDFVSGSQVGRFERILALHVSQLTQQGRAWERYTNNGI